MTDKTAPATASAPPTTVVADGAPPAAPQAPSRPLTGAEIAAKLRARMAEPAPAAAPVATAEAASDGTAAPAEAPATPKPNHRDAAALLAAQRAERRALEEKRASEALQRELADLKAKVAKYDEDPHYKLAKDPLAYADAMRTGKLAPPEEGKSALPPEWEEVLSEHKRLKSEAQQRQESEAKASQRKADLELTSKAVEAVAEEFPAMARLGNISEQLLNVIDSRPGGAAEITPEDFRALCKEINDHVVNEARAVLSTKSAVTSILADAKVKALVLEALGLPPEQSEDVGTPAKVNGAVSTEPRTLSARATNAVPSRNRGLSSAEIAAKLRSQFSPTE